mgnify:CR=1 FL=1
MSDPPTAAVARHVQHAKDFGIEASLAGIDLSADPKLAPLVSISASPLQGKFDVQASHLDQLVKFSKISVADLITACQQVANKLEALPPLNQP